MENIEANIINSFQLAKSDIIKLQDNYMELKRAQARILEKLVKLEAKKTVTPVKVVKTVKAKKPVKTKKTKKPTLTRKSVRKTYVASKEGKKFHMSNCPFAQNIKPKTKIKFKTKTKPLNLGYKPCSCVK